MQTDITEIKCIVGSNGLISQKVLAALKNFSDYHFCASLFCRQASTWAEKQVLFFKSMWYLKSSGTNNLQPLIPTVSPPVLISWLRLIIFCYIFFTQLNPALLTSQRGMSWKILVKGSDERCFKMVQCFRHNSSCKEKSAWGLVSVLKGWSHR